MTEEELKAALKKRKMKGLRSHEQLSTFKKREEKNLLWVGG